MGGLLSISQPGSVASYMNNAKGLPSRVKYLLDDGTAMEEAFTYDALGHIIGSERKGNAAGLTRNAAYAYDAAGRLLSYREGQDIETYGYDALGNRISRTVNGSEKSVYQYNAWNQLTAMTENGMSYSYGYDKRGNLTEERRGGSLIRQYAYDVTNHMVLGKDLESGEQTEYGYNGLYMRVRNVQTPAEGSHAGIKEISYAADYLSRTNNDLMAYGKGTGVMRAVYGRGYECLNRQLMPSTDG